MLFILALSGTCDSVYGVFYCDPSGRIHCGALGLHGTLKKNNKIKQKKNIPR